MPPVRVVDPAVQAQLRDARFQPLGRNRCSRAIGLCASARHCARIEIAEQAGRLRVPAPPQVRRERRQAAMRGRQELAERARFADDGRHLRAGGRQQPHDVLAVGARLHRLQHQHALQQAPIDDRHPDEGVVRILAGFAEVLETRMAPWRSRPPGASVSRRPGPRGPPTASCGCGRRFRAAGRSSRPAPASTGRARAGTPNTRRSRSAAG